MRGGVRDSKNIAKLAILTWVMILAVLFAMGASRWFTAITRSEETNAVFNEAAVLPADQLDTVLWQPDAPDLRREMEPLTRVDVTSAWLRAWEQLSIVAQTGDTTGLEVYFSNSALDGLLASVDDSRDLPSHQLAHELRVDFYSRDGQVIGLTAERVELVRAAEVGEVTGWLQTDESYEAILLLEDGNWRIQHWVRRGIDDRWWTDPVAGASDVDELALRGINYTPRDTVVDIFGENYDRDVIDADLARVAALGLDSVRIALPFDELGGRETTRDDLRAVLDVMDLADSHELGVVVTLFEGRTDHRPVHWDADRAHLTAVVEALRDHPALALWDLKNAPDLDIGTAGVEEQLVYAWLGHLAHSTRELDARTPMTISWSSPRAALAAPVQVDVLSFHHDGPAEHLAALGDDLIAHAAGRPIALTQFGQSTWNSVFPGGHTEAEQARYYADVLTVAGRLGITNTMSSSLWDLTTPPPGAGLGPWSSGPLMHNGILRVDGTPKPAASLVGPNADLTAVEPLSILHRFTQTTFWRLMIVAAGMLGVLWFVGGRIRDRNGGKTSPRQRRSVDEVHELSSSYLAELEEAAFDIRPLDRWDDDVDGPPVPEPLGPTVETAVQIRTSTPIKAALVPAPGGEPKTMLETLEDLARVDEPTPVETSLPWPRLQSQLVPPPIPPEALAEHRGWVGSSIVDAGSVD